MYYIVVLFLVLLGIFQESNAQASSPTEVSFQNLEIGHVAIRGFLYKSSDGQWILVDKPNLKSCCIEKEKTRIVVRGTLPEDANGTVALLLQGDLRPDGSKYILDNAIVIEEHHGETFGIIVGVAIATIAAIFLYKKTKGTKAT
jgi:hypothetical protein